MNIRICPETGKKMIRGNREITLEHKGQSIIINMPGWYADGIEDGLHSQEDLKIYDRALLKLKTEANDLLNPEEIKKIRKSLHLTQSAAGQFIGGGPKAFQKYEAGELLPSKAICNLLKILSKIPTAIEILKQPSNHASR